MWDILFSVDVFVTFLTARGISVFGRKVRLHPQNTIVHIYHLDFMREVNHFVQGSNFKCNPKLDMGRDYPWLGRGLVWSGWVGSGFFLTQWFGAGLTVWVRLDDSCCTLCQ